MPLGQGMESAQQKLPRFGEGRAVGNQGAKALRSRDHREVAELDLERHRPARHFGPLDPRPRETGNPFELGRQPLGVAQILVEGTFRAVSIQTAGRP